MKFWNTDIDSTRNTEDNAPSQALALTNKLEEDFAIFCNFLTFLQIYVGETLQTKKSYSIV